MREKNKNTEAEAAAEAIIPEEETQPAVSELDELKDSYLRLAAEYDNFRKRTQKERDALYALATAAAVESFLPVYDNIERALQAETNDLNYKRGVEMVMKQLEETFARLGVSKIPAERGTPFDPELHNAVMHVEDDTLQAGVVAEAFQSGFKLGDKIIRHAVVKAAN